MARGRPKNPLLGVVESDRETSEDENNVEDEIQINNNIEEIINPLIAKLKNGDDIMIESITELRHKIQPEIAQVLRFIYLGKALTAAQETLIEEDPNDCVLNFASLLKVNYEDRLLARQRKVDTISAASNNIESKPLNTNNITRWTTNSHV